MTTYQIAETLGMTAEQVRDTLSPTEMCEWAVYLNSPFSRRGREATMNGWLVHVIRSIMADKRRPPKFSDSMFPFEKLAREFFIPPKPARSAPPAPGKVTTVAEAMHIGQVMSQRYEKVLEDYRAGRITNRLGLYVNEEIGR